MVIFRSRWFFVEGGRQCITSSMVISLAPTHRGEFIRQPVSPGRGLQLVSQQIRGRKFVEAIFGGEEAKGLVDV